MLRLLRKRRTPPQEAHICTPPSLCCWLHTQERGDTICLQRRHTMRKLSEKHGPTEFGKFWIKRHSGSHYIVFKAWSATVLDCCTRAMRITEVVDVLLFCFSLKDSSISVAALHLHTLIIYLWTMQVDKAWFLHSVHSGQ